MTVNHKPTGTASSIPAGLAGGAMTSLALTIAGALITANLLSRQVIPWSGSGYGVLLILLLASWAGAAVSAGRIKRLRAMICMASGVIYFLLLLLSTALFFGGRYSGVGETGLLIFCGSMLGLFPVLPGKKRRNRRKNSWVNR